VTASRPDLPFRTITARFWRVLAPRRAQQPLSGEGAARHGGRWNPRGLPALYMSADLITAVAEYEQDIGVRPGTFCAFDVRIDRIVDLTRLDALAACGVDPADRFAPWKTMFLVRHETPPGWRIADRLIQAGANGILVPSVQFRSGTNLVLWRWNDAPVREVVALDPQTDLPRNQSSWGTPGLLDQV
jgi:RES domain-containing protein